MTATNDGGMSDAGRPALANAAESLREIGALLARASDGDRDGAPRGVSDSECGGVAGKGDTAFIGGELVVQVKCGKNLDRGRPGATFGAYAILECQGDRRSTPVARVSHGTMYVL